MPVIIIITYIAHRKEVLTMKPESTHATSAADTVTVAEVAAVALKIGQEIWGEEQFTELMKTDGQAEPAAHAASAPPVPITPAKTYRGKQKKEPA